MRQRREIKRHTIAVSFVELAHYRIQLVQRHELLNREFPDRYHEPRCIDRDLSVEPGRTIRDLIPIGHAISTAGPLTREAAAYRSHVNTAAERVFIDADFTEPLEQHPSRCPRKRLAESAL